MGDKTLGARLRAARENAAMKPSAVCEATGIPNIQTLSAYERGAKLPDDEVLVRLASTYNVPVKSLLEDVSEVASEAMKKADYIRQLVEAATALNLGFITHTDPYGKGCKYSLSLSSIDVENFFRFAEKGSVLCQLHNDGIISREEYTRVVLDRLSDLKMD